MEQLSSPTPEYQIPNHETSDLAAVLLEKKMSVETTTKASLAEMFSQVREEDTLYSTEVQGATVDHAFLEEALAVSDPRERYKGKEDSLWTDEIDYVNYDTQQN